MGNVFKVLLVYEKPFWREGGHSGFAVSKVGPIRFFFESSGEEGKACLGGLVSGAHSRELSSMDPRERREKIVQQVERIYGKEKMLAYFEKDWNNDKYCIGGYNCIHKPGVLSQCGHLLAKPIGRVFLAGTEHASHAAGYMEGAILSGEKAANDLLSLISK